MFLKSKEEEEEHQWNLWCSIIIGIVISLLLTPFSGILVGYLGYLETKSEIENKYLNLRIRVLESTRTEKKS